MRFSSSAIRTWLQLLRAPNLFTVPGDPLAGFLLASGGLIDSRLYAAVLACLLFYGFGLLLNDLADLDEDRRERPQRPLPSGAAQPRTVGIVAGVMGIVGLVLAGVTGWRAFLVAVALVTAIAVYNYRSKRNPTLGPINMGLCRGLSLLLGAFAAQTPGVPVAIPLSVWMAAAGLTFYIAIVTNLARVETQASPARLPRILPFIALILVVVPLFFVALNFRNPLTLFNVALYAVSAYTLYAGFKVHEKLDREPSPPIPPMIGQLIRILLPLQAIWCLASHSRAGGFGAAALLALWPISRAVSRKFYAS